MMDKEKIVAFTENKHSIQNLVGAMLQEGKICISDDGTFWNISVSKREIILMETDMTAEDPMDREVTFSDLYAIDLLNDAVLTGKFNIPFDIDSLLEVDRNTLEAIKERMNELLPEKQIAEINSFGSNRSKNIEEDER